MCDARFTQWSADEHHADRTALSFSMLRRFGSVDDSGEDINPGLFRAHLGGEVAERRSDALEFGILAHVARYEPRRLETDFAARPTKDDGTLHRKGSKVYEAWAAENAGKRDVSPQNLETACAIARVVAESPATGKLDRLRVVAREQSIVWTDAETGLLLKIRPDRILERLDGTWVDEDLKTTTDVTPRAFRAQCFRFAYFDRCAFYLDGLEALTGQPARCVLVAVTKEPPFQVAAYEPRAQWIDEARHRNRALLREVARCFETNDWLAPWEAEPMML